MTTGVNIKKRVLHLKGQNKRGREVMHNELSRERFFQFIANLQPSTIAMETGCRAHHRPPRFTVQIDRRNIAVTFLEAIISFTALVAVLIAFSTQTAAGFATSQNAQNNWTIGGAYLWFSSPTELAAYLVADESASAFPVDVGWYAGPNWANPNGCPFYQQDPIGHSNYPTQCVEIALFYSPGSSMAGRWAGGTVTFYESPDPIGQMCVDGTYALVGQACVGKSVGNSVSACRCSVGDPIDVASGNVFEEVVDYSTAGLNQLQFVRYYNSLPITTLATELGNQWRSNFDRYIRIISSISVVAERPNGQQLTFTLTNNVWTPDSDVHMTLTQSSTNWTLVDHDDNTETYITATGGNSALVNTIVARNGYTQTLSWSGSQLASVTDSYSRSLVFAYYPNGLLQSTTTPDGTTIEYGYTNAVYFGENLSTVTYPTTIPSTVGYNYGNAALQSALTSITDENGNTYASWTFDGYGRGLTSALGAEINANITSVSYHDSTGSRTVTNASGVSDLYTFTILQGVPKVSSISRAATSTTAAAIESMTYDSNGYLASLIDWNGNKTVYTNDAFGDSTKIVEAFGTSQSRTTTIKYNSIFVDLPATVVTPEVTTTYSYDSSGEILKLNLNDTTTTASPYSTHGQKRTWAYSWSNFLPASIETPNRHTTHFTYGPDGALTDITNPLGQQTQITAHMGGGQPLTVVDPNNVTTNFTYDGRQRLVTSAVNTSQGVLTTSRGYDPSGNLISVTAPDGSYLNYGYDTAHRVTTTTDANGNTINYMLDAFGNATTTTVRNPLGVATSGSTATPDALGRIIARYGGMNEPYSYGYDPNSNLTSYGIAGLTVNYAVDHLNRWITKATAPYGQIGRTLDPHDRPLTLTDGNGNTTSYVYDGFGDVIEHASPDTGVTVFYYDADGNVTSKTDALGVVTTHTYDALDRVLTTRYPSDTALDVAFHYDQVGTGYSFGIGHLTSMKDAAGGLTRDYDERGNLLIEARVKGGITLVTQYGYDGASRVVSVTYPSGDQIAYARDLTANITSVTQTPAGGSAASVASSITYEPFGPFTGFTFGNGITEAVGYDQSYNALTFVDKNGGATLRNSTYGYQANDLQTSYFDNLNSAHNLSNTPDGLQRIGAQQSAIGSYSFTLDNNSNRSATTYPSAITYSNTPQTNQLASIVNGGTTTTVATNADGNITGFSPGYGTPSVTALNYTAANRLASVDGPSGTLGVYVYDGLGRRFSKTVGTTTTYFVYSSDGSTVLAEKTGPKETDYLYLNGRPLAIFSAYAGTMLYLMDDQIGRPQIATNANRTVEWSAVYGSSFGDAITVSALGKTTVNLRYPGQYFDAETGLNHNGFRNYVPTLGRYVEADPLGIALNDTGGLNSRMNPYVYANENPPNNVDLVGLVNQNWFRPGSSFYSWGQHYAPLGVYTILGHGDPGHFCGPALCGTPGAQDISAQNLALLIYNDPNYWPGMPVQLIACETGVGQNSYAQQLANELGKLATFAGQQDFSTVYGADGLVRTPSLLILPLPPIVTNGWSPFGNFLPFNYKAN